MTIDTDGLPEPEPSPPRCNPPARLVCLDDLLHGDKELLIQHGAEVYRLRLTRNGRLLLTK